MALIDGYCRFKAFDAIDISIGNGSILGWHIKIGRKLKNVVVSCQFKANGLVRLKRKASSMVSDFRIQREQMNIVSNLFKEIGIVFRGLDTP